MLTIPINMRASLVAVIEELETRGQDAAGADMTTALALAFRRAAEMQARTSRSVVVPAAEPVHPGVARRHAVDAPLNVRPISILRPVPETAQDVHEECLLCFPAAARRLAR